MRLRNLDAVVESAPTFQRRDIRCTGKDHPPSLSMTTSSLDHVEAAAHGACSTPCAARGRLKPHDRRGRVTVHAAATALRVLPCTFRSTCDRRGRPRQPHGNGMSEGAGFVNTELLEEEHHQGLKLGRRRATFCTTRRAPPAPSTLGSLREGGQGRPQAARRGSLDGPVISLRIMDMEARQGFLGAPFRWPPVERGALVVSSSPRVVRVRRGRSSAAWPCLRRAPSPGPAWRDPAQPAVLNHK